MANHSARRRARAQLDAPAQPPAPKPKPEIAKRQPIRDLSAEDGRAAGRFAVATLSGAVTAVIGLIVLKLSLAELWLPFQIAGTRLIVDLVLSGIAGGLAAALFAEGTPPVQAAGACALGWGIFGLWIHVHASGLYFDVLNSLEGQATTTPSRAVDIYFANAMYHQEAVLAGLLAAAAAAWCVERVLQKTGGARPTQPTELQRPNLARATTFPVALIVLGSVALWLLGWIPISRVPDTFKTMPPLHVSHAVLAAIVAVLAFGTPAYALRSRAKALGTVGYLLAGPLATAILATIILNINRQAMSPVAALLWSSSPLELASFCTFGAVAGYWLRDVNSLNE